MKAKAEFWFLNSTSARPKLNIQKEQRVNFWKLISTFFQWEPNFGYAKNSAESFGFLCSLWPVWVAGWIGNNAVVNICCKFYQTPVKNHFKCLPWRNYWYPKDQIGKAKVSLHWFWLPVKRSWILVMVKNSASCAFYIQVKLLKWHP